MIEHNHTLWLLAGGGRRGIHFRGDGHWLLLIPEVVLAEHKVAQMLRQPCGLEYFNLKGKKAPFVSTSRIQGVLNAETRVGLGGGGCPAPALSPNMHLL